MFKCTCSHGCRFNRWLRRCDALLPRRLISNVCARHVKNVSHVLKDHIHKIPFVRVSRIVRSTKSNKIDDIRRSRSLLPPLLLPPLLLPPLLFHPLLFPPLLLPPLLPLD